MSEAAPPERGPDGASAPGRLTLAVMATVLAFALIVAVDGVMSLVTDRDVIVEPDAGPLVAVAMAATTCAFVFILCFRRVPTTIALRAVVTALGAVVLAPLAGSVVYAMVRSEPAAAIVFFGRYVVDQFVIVTALIAASVVVAHALVPVHSP